MSAQGGHRSLAEQLRSWPDDRLARLFSIRPDLATPAPHDFGQLASRAHVRASLSRALDALTTGELWVLHALIGAGQTTVGELADRLGADPARVGAVVEELADRALVWDGPHGWKPLSGMAEVLGTPPPLTGGWDDVPEPAASPREQTLVDRAGGGAAFEVVRRVELVLDHWSAEPPTVLRSGGLAVRDFKAAERLLVAEGHVVALVIELANEAGLLARRADAEGNQVWVPTDAFDAWTGEPTAERWVRLATAWLRSSRTPHRVGTKDVNGKARNALDPNLFSPAIADARHWALRAMTTLPEGQVLAAGTGLPSLLAWVRHQRPRRPAGHADLVAAAVSEAAQLGFLGLDGLTGFGRALLDDGESAAATALAPLLPEPVDHVLVQADLTAIAPGPLEAALARRLQLVAEVESRGGATVYRFTPSSIRRALDVGWTGAELHGFVSSVSRTPVPQALSYLIDDSVRTYGVLRVGMAEAFIRADDETALSELLGHPRAGGLGLRRIAPTVLISTLPLDLLLPRLREMGVAPAVEGPDGAIAVSRPTPLRARTPAPGRRAGAASARDAAHLTRVVNAVRSGDRAAQNRPAEQRLSPAEAMQTLREAIDTSTDVVVEYVDNHGLTTRRLLTPRRVDGGLLVALDHTAQDERGFAVHRIRRVTAAGVS